MQAAGRAMKGDPVIEEACMSRKPWDLAFTAEPEEVAALRRIVRLHLQVWGLQEVTDEAQLCVSELVSNVITHVGQGTPATLAISMSGTHLRIEVHDPDARALPTLIDATPDAESGRGMALVSAIAARWGVQLLPSRKVTWCELATALTSVDGHVDQPGVERAEALLDLCMATTLSSGEGTSRLTTVVVHDLVIGAIADFLHWLRAHGSDVEEVLDCAQTRFEAEVMEIRRQS